MSGPEQLPGGLQRELQVASMSWGRLLRLGVLAYGQITMLVGDASGKGVAAALMMTSVQASLRTAAQFTGDNLAGLLWTVNAQAWASTPTDRYATLFYGVLNWVTLTLRYVNAARTRRFLFIVTDPSTGLSRAVHRSDCSPKQPGTRRSLISILAIWSLHTQTV